VKPQHAAALDDGQIRITADGNTALALHAHVAHSLPVAIDERSASDTIKSKCES
jgi:2,3-bisphosphoglycerate-independent phosphoglycerate mutase